MNQFLLKPRDQLGVVSLRLKYYYIFLGYHIVVFLIGPVGISLAESNLIPVSSAFMGMFFLANMAILNVIIWRMLSFFVKKNVLISYAVFTVVLMVGFAVLNAPILLTSYQSSTVQIITMFSLTIQVIVINYVILYDIFENPNKLNYNLIGAANAF
ncbi:MAG: hypothetical protein ACJA2S_003462 [Cyclobacteriaceae bacterium]|jgi:hypothetical protein